MITPEECAEIVAQARYWFDRDECPGCGASLRAVAGAGDRHVTPNQHYKYGFSGPTGVSVAGGRTGRHTCPVTADQLTALCHIAAGIVSVKPS